MAEGLGPLDLGRLDRLRARAQALVEQLGDGPAAEDRFDGLDASRTVRVSVDVHGRITAVRVGSGWRSSLGADLLGPAIVEAAEAAFRAAARAWSHALAHRSPAKPVTDAAGPPRVSMTRIGDLDSTAAAMRDMHYLAMDVTSTLAKAARSAVEPPAEVSGSSGPVTVRLAGGRLMQVRFAAGWLASASTTVIGEQVHTACEQARAQVGAAALGRLSLDELRKVTADPATLLGRLGFQLHGYEGT